MPDSTEEWFRQADYDLDTAECMLQADRRFYAVFMAHLAVEKALKGLHRRKTGTSAPRTHNLLFLLQKMGLSGPTDKQQFLVELTEAQVATRYAEELAKRGPFRPIEFARFSTQRARWSSGHGRSYKLGSKVS